MPPGESTTNLLQPDFNPQIYEAERRHASRSEQAEQKSHQILDDRTMHSILLAIPSLGRGFEHILGSTPKVGKLIKLFTEEGFLCAVPLKLPDVVQRSEGFGISLEGTAHSSCISLASATSSTASLTSSQKDIFGMEEKIKWPLRSKTQISERSIDLNLAKNLEAPKKFLPCKVFRQP